MTNLYSVNLRHAQSDEVKQLVSSLIRLDRLPTEESLEGLYLLRQAWDECASAPLATTHRRPPTHPSRSAPDMAAAPYPPDVAAPLLHASRMRVLAGAGMTSRST